MEMDIKETDKLSQNSEIYFGADDYSKIIPDRGFLNGAGFVLGVPGDGQSFTVKNETADENRKG